MSEKLWQGRFAEKTAKIVEAFTASIEVDRRLYAYDIEGSMAHCRMLAKTGIIADADAELLVQGLSQIRQEIEAGKFQFDDSLEDIHMHIEARLVEIVGKTAQKLHTARSRNDQVALDMRMYLRDETARIIGHLSEFQRVIIQLAKSHIDTVMPGYTHTQRAQPVLLAHHLMAYFEMFGRDSQRFNDCLQRINVMPLGCAALAGTTYPIDRAYVAELLNFPEVSTNSMDSVGDRDFIIEFLADASICMMHLSRWAEELILWSSSEFGFIELPDAFATGSSIMPQKKNPDVPELIRGKTGGVYGNLMALLTLMKGLSLTYNRDMQEDKVLLFDTVDTLTACLEIFIQMLPNIVINKEAMTAAASAGFLNATDLADYLVTRGMPFREAHHCVGEAVNFAFHQHKELHQLTLEELQKFSDLIRKDVFSFLSTQAVVDRRTSFGGTGSSEVKKAIKTAEKRLDLT